MGAQQQALVSKGPRVYATWSPSDKGSNITLTNSNLTATGAASLGAQEQVRATIGKSTGKW